MKNCKHKLRHIMDKVWQCEVCKFKFFKCADDDPPYKQIARLKKIIKEKEHCLRQIRKNINGSLK